MDRDNAKVKRWVREFLFTTPLHASKTISFAESNALFAAPLVVEGYCAKCGRASTFYRNRGGKGPLNVQASLETHEPLYFDLVCARDVKHRIIFTFRFDKGQIKKTAQYPPPAEAANYPLPFMYSRIFEKFRDATLCVSSLLPVGEASPTAEVAADKAQLTYSPTFKKMRDLVGNVISSLPLPATQASKPELRLPSASIQDQKIQPAHAVVLEAARTRRAGFRIDESSLQVSGLFVAIVLVIIGVLMLYEDAKKTPSRPPLEQAAQHVDDRASAEEKIKSRMTTLAQQIDERFATLRAELERLDLSISRDKDLIAALGARENQQEAAIAAQLDQEKQQSAPNTTERDASGTPDAAAVSILPDNPETDLDTSKLVMLDKTGTTPRAGKPANSEIPHIGIGVAKGSAKDGGLVILEVDLGSPAGRAGVRKHDLLLKVDGTPVSRPDQLREALLSLKGSHSIVLTLERQGKTQRNKLILN
jgi:hypothetical protein